MGQLRSFLGMANYFRRFVKGYSNLVKPPNHLLRKDAVWKWTSDCQKAFDKAKHVLVTVPVLAQPDFSKRFEVIAMRAGMALGLSCYRMATLLHLKAEVCFLLKGITTLVSRNCLLWCMP